MRLGWKAKLYLGVAGTAPSPPAGEITKIKDVSIALTHSEQDATLRSSGGVSEFIQGMQGRDIEFDMPTDRENPNYVALRTSFLTGNAVAILALDEESGEGPDGDFAVFDFSRSEPLDGIMMTKVKIKPTPSTRPQDWHTPA